jgi:tRNA pseudouridine38-40 synthase
MSGLLRPTRPLLAALCLAWRVSELERSVTYSKAVHRAHRGLSIMTSQPGTPSTSVVSEADQGLKRRRMAEASEAGPSQKKPKILVTQDIESTVPEEAAAQNSSNALASKNQARRNQTRRTGRERRERNKEQGMRRGTRPEGEEVQDSDEPKGPRLPKRQCALLIGYCGSGYSGMQWYVISNYFSYQLYKTTGNCFRQPEPHIRTIERVLFDALVKAGAVSQDNADNPTKAYFPSCIYIFLLV